MTTTTTTPRARTLRHRSTLWVRPVLLLAALALSSGCARLVASSVGDALAKNSLVYAGDDDVELVGAAIPFGLKTMETLLVQVPEHRALLTAAARGFTQYAYVYVQLPADELEDIDVGRCL